MCIETNQRGEMKTVLKQNSDIRLLADVLKSPRVLALAIGLPGLVGSLLRWRGSSVRLLAVLVSLLQGDTDARRRASIEMSNLDLARVIWPELSTPESAKNKVGRWLRALDEDQGLSRAAMVQRVPGRMVQDGKRKEFLLSRYSVVDFDNLAEIVGCRIESQFRGGGLVSLDAMRRVVGESLVDLGCVPILPEMRRAEKQRQVDSRDSAKTRKQIERAKRGEIEMDYQSILGLSRSDRIEVLCGQFLLWGAKLLDEIQDIPLDELRWVAEGMQRKFASSVALTLERRFAAERREVERNAGKAA